MLLYVVSILGLVIGLVNLGILYKVAQRTGLLPAPKTPFKPIKHERAEGTPAPLTSRVMTGVVSDYYRPKDQPEAEAFIALHYQGGHMEKDIPKDTYVTDNGKVIRGDVFRENYVRAEDIAVRLGTPIAAPTHSRVVSPASTKAPKLTDEEEQKLAEEYELVERPSP